MSQDYEIFARTWYFSYINELESIGHDKSRQAYFLHAEQFHGSS